MGLLTRDQILVARDVGHTDIEVPEWGGSVRLRAMTASARDTFEQKVHQSAKDGSPATVRALMAVMCIVGPDDQPMFTLEDVQALGDKSGKALDRIYDAVTKLNALTSKEMEELEKNSSAAPSGDSSSASQNDSGKQ